MQAVKDTYNDDTSNISGNVILLKIQTQLKNIKSFYHVNNFGYFMTPKKHAFQQHLC